MEIKYFAFEALKETLLATIEEQQLEESVDNSPPALGALAPETAATRDREENPLIRRDCDDEAERGYELHSAQQSCLLNRSVQRVALVAQLCPANCILRASGTDATCRAQRRAFPRVQRRGAQPAERVTAALR